MFTEFNQKLQQNERYVYVASGETFSKRSVRIGVADYFFAEVQQGVQAGDVVALEKPSADKIVETAPAKAESRPGGAAKISATNT